MRGAEGEDKAGRANEEGTEGNAIPKGTTEATDATTRGRDAQRSTPDTNAFAEKQGCCRRCCPSFMFAPLPGQEQARKLYGGPMIQLFIAVMIFLNFIQSAAKAQFLFVDGVPEPEDTFGSKAFWYSEIFFASVFTAELFLNIYANWIRRFFSDSWNIFDLFIVIISVISIGVPDMPAISVLRLFRAFRAFRLFKRISNLRVIVVGAFRCLPSVSYAFLVLGLITGIWSIMAVEFYGNDKFCEGFDKQLGHIYPGCMEMFGQFSYAMLTMFQVTTFDSWSSGVLRPMLLSSDSALEQLQLGIFFISYVFATAIILTNVVVAILLDKFLAASEELVTEDCNELIPDNEQVDRLAHPDAVKTRILEAVSQISQMLTAHELRRRTDVPKVDTQEKQLLMKLLHGVNGPNGKIPTCHPPEQLEAFHQTFDGYATQIQCYTRGYLARLYKLRVEEGRQRQKRLFASSRSFLLMKQTLVSARQSVTAASIKVKREVTESLLGRTWSWCRTIKLPFQTQVKEFYEWKSTQTVVAGLIFINFFASAIKAELNPLNALQKDIFDILEAVFGFLFLIELIINLWGNWLVRFWSDPWNIFDFLVVVISILAVFVPTMPGVSVLRLFRAFRAFRLFKRVEQLKRIVFGALRSLPRVSYAFAILIMIMGIWSIMAVEFYGKESPDLFGNFFLSMLTLFQVMTFDSWSSGVARPVIVNKKGGLTAGVFFICYVFIASIIMVNVVIAIFVDQFLNNEPEHNEGEPQPITESSVHMTLADLENDMTSELVKIRRVVKRQVRSANPRLPLKLEGFSMKFVKELKQRLDHIEHIEQQVNTAASGGS